MKYLIVLIALLGVLAAGCGSAEVQVTKDQEAAFRNPPKEPPAGAAEGMQKGMAEAQRRSQAAGGTTK